MKPRKQTPKSDTVTRSFRIPLDMDEQIQALAKADDRSLSYVILSLLEDALSKTTDGSNAKDYAEYLASCKEARL